MSEADFELFDRHTMTLSGSFEFDGFAMLPAEVIEKIEPLLTEERISRIEQVLNGRCSQFCLVMENIYDRGNVSAVLRSAESFGFFACHLIEKKEATFKASARVTKGAEKWMHIEKFETATESVNRLKADGFQVFATDLEAAKPIHEVDFSKPTALVLGNEKQGISEEMRRACDGSVIIPMAGFSQSFKHFCRRSFKLLPCFRGAQTGRVGR
jgi:tRNA (guanosine-2'-O-)-methyltransferase